MGRLKTKELRQLSDDELGEELEKARTELFDARMQLSTRQLKNYRGMTAARRRIARALTIKGERTEKKNG